MTTQQKRKGYFGQFGGRFVPELLVPALQQLEDAFEFVKGDLKFNQELDDLLKNYVGRPTPLTKCQNYFRPYSLTPIPSLWGTRWYMY